MSHSPSATRAAFLLLAIGVTARIVMLWVYQPVAYPDTGTYHTLASQILNFDFRDYQGLRTPGYAFLLILAGQNHFFVWLIQSALGVLTSLLLFRLCLAHTGNSTWSLFAGLAHTLALNQLFFEANMLSETLSTFVLVLSVASMVAALKRRASGNGGMAGLVSAFAALTRAIYLYVGPLYALLVLLFERDRKRLAAAVAVASVLPVLGWAVFNQVTIGYFGISTMGGYNLSNHSGRFIERAGDQYATIRDIYLKHREQKIAETGHHQMTIFDARDEILEKTGLDEVTLSRQLTKLSLELFARYPVLYLKGVAESWASFWAAPNYMRWDKFTVPGAARVVEGIWSVERRFILMINFLAIAAGAWVLLRAAWSRLRGKTGVSIPLIISAVVMAASVLQALVEFGENPRYGIPTQSLAATLVLLVAWELRVAWMKRTPAAVKGKVAALEVEAVGKRIAHRC